MGVYIKGMEMPKSCDDCRIMVFEDTNCEAELYCGCTLVFKAHPQGVDHRPDYCPLVPVPPHGRLGDLDNLALLVLNWISTQEKAYPHEDSNALAWRLGAKAMGNQIYRDIKAYPTIIPAEEGE